MRRVDNIERLALAMRLSMISVRDALDLVLCDLSALGAEQIALTQAAGRALATPVRATRDVPPFRNAAMINKLKLPFPILSDPDRSGAIEPYGVADPKDKRNIARPAMFVIAPDREIVFSLVSRDYADRTYEEARWLLWSNWGFPPPSPNRSTSAPQSRVRTR